MCFVLPLHCACIELLEQRTFKDLDHKIMKQTLGDWAQEEGRSVRAVNK